MKGYINDLNINSTKYNDLIKEADKLLKSIKSQHPMLVYEFQEQNRILSIKKEKKNEKEEKYEE